MKKKNKRRGASTFIMFLLIAAAAFGAAYYLLSPRTGFPEANAPENAAPETNAEKELVAAKIEELKSAAEIDEQKISDFETILDNFNKIPYAYIEKALRNDESSGFAAGFVTYKKPRNNRPDIGAQVREASANGLLPRFIQWDKRWGYAEYGDSVIGIAGCGPTALSMVICGLTGRTDTNPAAVAEFAEKNGYYADGVGTSWGLMSDGAKSFGLDVKELPLDKTVIRNALDEGRPVIVSVRKGSFTDEGHFIVLEKNGQDGGFVVIDPNSPEKSREWPYSVLESDARNFWAFSVSSSSK